MRKAINVVRKHVLGRNPYCLRCGEMKVQSGYVGYKCLDCDNKEKSGGGRWLAGIL